MFILFPRWTAKFIRELSAVLPPFSCIYIQEALVIIVQRHYSPFLRRQSRAIQAENYIRTSQLNHLVPACFTLSFPQAFSACCLEIQSLLCLRDAFITNASTLPLPCFFPSLWRAWDHNVVLQASSVAESLCTSNHFAVNEIEGDVR